uniref:Uncharacterized protein LOC104234759 isoform X2 n=2 Tax=Nicotiana sylvestris TaxID=4096 RepID=A0A1U7XJM5_NICSY|nr:PREDICTED: uncharacterized protein LOC104234759 isoform X2 [Nicotiana sylvestris]
MSGDKKDVPISCSGQKNKSPCLTDRSAEMKFNRRKKYKEISADRKEALLLNRRMKELDSRKCLLESRTLDNLVKLISLSNSTLQRESALMIRDFSLTSNQEFFRIEVLQGILDVLRQGERDASRIGKQTFLPVTFTGGPRDMRQRYMDAISLVQRFGIPDLFLTMTCNPLWLEIKEYLLSTDEAQNRLDLISRVFRAKLEELKNDILKRNIFGKVVTFMYTVEFQKRGLPHAHFLIILANEYILLTPESYGRVVCAELPDPDKEPYLYSLVVHYMMHSLCGHLNPANSCMQNGYCKFNYPKILLIEHQKEKTVIHEAIKIREQFLDNSWMVPYNTFLLGKFNCHMNIKICSDIKIVMYLYKYICKGHDKISFSIHDNDKDKEIDEIKEYQFARWVSPPKDIRYLFGFSISEMTPSVYHLQLYLEGQQYVSFKITKSINAILKKFMIRKTMLTDLFVMNQIDDYAIELKQLNKEIPEYFVWLVTDKTWTRRK